MLSKTKCLIVIYGHLSSDVAQSYLVSDIYSFNNCIPSKTIKNTSHHARNKPYITSEIRGLIEEKNIMDVSPNFLIYLISIRYLS